ncbi:MAG: hypothetical protein RLN70_08535, partial [Rhodospirillaceae bacterium]
NLKLRPRILEHMEPGTRVVSHAFTMGDWDADEVDNIDGRHIYYWVVPADASGAWTWEVNGTSYRTVIDQEFQKLSGQVIAGGSSAAMEHGVMSGKTVTFETRARGASGGTSAMLFEGVIEGDVINATVYIDGDATDVVARRAD